MRKKAWLIAAIILVVGMALAGPQVALARQGGGTGTLTASGDGLAGLRGDGTIVISGAGVLWIRDHAGDASIEVSGQGVRRESPGGWIRYIGFDGEATVSGSAVTVALSGVNIDLEATGTGHFVLRGQGEYSVSGPDGTVLLEGTWTEEARVLELP